MKQIFKKGDILIVDDNIDNILFLATLLENNNYEVRQVKSGEEALQVVDYEPPELILLDIIMPELDGYEVCRQLKANPKTLDIPVIFLTGKMGLLDKIQAFEVGGVDYITKPFLLEEVLCRIENHLNIYKYKIKLREEIAIREKIQADLEAVNLKLKKLVNLDTLTTLANRRYFNQYLRQQWSHAKRENIPLSLLLVDIDFFKKYNDFYGHLEGDKCLRRVAQKIKRTVKHPTDLVARYGGEELAIILVNTGLEGAKKVGENLLEAVRKLLILHPQSQISSYLTISIGIATIIPSEQLARNDLIKKADQALYQAKNQGRDRLVFSDSQTP